MRRWLRSVLVAIDQLGNAIAGGNPDSTISARVGLFARQGRLYWIALERVIDYAFKPVDGDRHCRQAYYADSEEDFYQGSYGARLVLSLIVLIAAPVIGLVIRAALWIARKVK